MTPQDKEQILFVMLGIVVMIIMLLIMSGLAYGLEYEYTLMKRYNRPYIDVNKTYKGDDNMCWAAAVVNSAHFSSGLKGKKIAKEGFNWLLKVHGNTGEKMDVGYALYLKQDRDYLYRNGFVGFMFHKRKKKFLKWIGAALDQGEVVTLQTELTDAIGAGEGQKKTYRHALTVYGYAFNGKSIALIYVDSDDGKRKLYKESIVMNKDGTLTFAEGSEYHGYIITGAFTLNVVKE
jgi:hypothetical protein